MGQISGRMPACIHGQIARTLCVCLPRRLRGGNEHTDVHIFNVWYCLDRLWTLLSLLSLGTRASVRRESGRDWRLTTPSLRLHGIHGDGFGVTAFIFVSVCILSVGVNCNPSEKYTSNDVVRWFCNEHYTIAYGKLRVAGCEYIDESSGVGNSRISWLYFGSGKEWTQLLWVVSDSCSPALPTIAHISAS